MEENTRVYYLHKINEKKNKRLQIMKNNENIEIKNNAKTGFIQKLKKYLNNSDILKSNHNIKLENLTGDVDLQIIKQYVKDDITELSLENGNITNIENIPETLKSLNLQNNLLESFSLSISLKKLQKLNLVNNLITDIDLTFVPNVIDLNLSNNQLNEITNIPSTIVILNISHNNITQLDLTGLNNLKSLICNNNKLVSIKNIPKNLQEISYYENPLKEIQELTDLPNIHVQSNPNKKSKIQKKHAPKQTKLKPQTSEENETTQVEYKDAIYEYFKLKKEYETNLKKKRDDLKRKFKKTQNEKRFKKEMETFKGICIGCKKNVGSIFTKKNGYYIAICGNGGRTPCSLNIKIYNGQYYDFFEDMHMFKERMNSSKQDIIKQKMDVLFHFANDTKAMEKFKNVFEEYKDNNASFTVLFEKYQLIYNNPSKMELIHLKNEKINEIINNIEEMMDEYKKNPLNKTFLQDAIHKQYNELTPELESLRNLKYEFIDVINTYVTNSQNYECKESVLIEKEHSFEKFIYMVEEPKVIDFSV